MSRQVVSLAGMTEEAKLELAIGLMEWDVNQGVDADDVWGEYVNAAGPRGLREADLDDLLEWLSFGTGIIITIDKSG